MRARDAPRSKRSPYETKNGSPRGVPINRAVYDALVALEPRQEARTGLLFKRRDGAAWGQVRTAFATIAGFRFHDLRHTATTW